LVWFGLVWFGSVWFDSIWVCAFITYIIIFINYLKIIGCAFTIIVSWKGQLVIEENIGTTYTT
jgi:hypothetical protein